MEERVKESETEHCNTETPKVCPNSEDHKFRGNIFIILGSMFIILGFMMFIFLIVMIINFGGIIHYFVFYN